MMLINDEWCYLHISKTSGTNLRINFLQSSNKVRSFAHHKKINSENLKVLENVSKKFWAEDPHSVFAKFSNQFPDIKLFKLWLETDYFKNIHLCESQHAPLWIWQSEGIVKDHKIFTIVRNPYTRFISCCNNVLKWAQPILPQMSLRDFIQSDFLKLVEDLPYNHIKNQYEFLLDENQKIKVDKFYKVETDLPKVESDFSLTNLTQTMYNQGNYKRNYSQIYTSETINFVQRTFKTDFDFFGYDLEPFW